MRAFFDKIDAMCCKLEEFILAVGILLVTFITTGNAISRKVFSYSWSSAEECTQFLLVIITFMGVSYGVRKGRHIRITAFYVFMPKCVQKALTLIICLVTAFILFYLAYYAFDYVAGMYRVGRVTPALRVPFWMTIIWVPIGFILAGIQYLRAFYKNLIEKDVWISAEVSSEYSDEFIGGGTC